MDEAYHFDGTNQLDDFQRGTLDASHVITVAQVEQSLAAAREKGDRAAELSSLTDLGLLALEQKDVARAIGCLLVRGTHWFGTGWPRAVADSGDAIHNSGSLRTTFRNSPMC